MESEKPRQVKITDGRTAAQMSGKVLNQAENEEERRSGRSD